MSTPCEGCEHRRSPTRVLPRRSATGVLARKEEQQRTEELRRRRDYEHSASESGPGTRPVTARPMFVDWCGVGGPRAGREGATDAATFFLCTWLLADHCPNRVPTGGTPEDRTPRTPSRPARAGEVPVSAGSMIQLGTAMELRTTAVSTATTRHGGGRPGSIDRQEFELEQNRTGTRVTIDGAGLQQTYLIFGAPGSGKTHLFSSMLRDALALDERPATLVLDPKGVLVDAIESRSAAAGRTTEVIGSRSLDTTTSSSTRNGHGCGRESYNILGCAGIKPALLGRLLAEIVLIEAGDLPAGWQVYVSDLLEAATVLMQAELGHVTAAGILADVLRPVKGTSFYNVQYRSAHLVDDPREDVQAARAKQKDYFQHSDPAHLKFVRQVIDRALGGLLDSDWAHLSDSSASSRFYEELIREQKVVLLSVGHQAPAFQRAVCSLVKALFQYTALQVGGEELRAGRVPTMSLLACDEFAQVITESESGLVSDSTFFSQAREYRCLSILALQSTATARARFPPGLRDRWDALLGNVSAKIFLRAADNDTAEMASALVGDRDWTVPVESSTLGPETTQTFGSSVVTRRMVPPFVLTQKLVRGQGLAVGSLDGGRTVGAVFFAADGDDEGGGHRGRPL